MTVARYEGTPLAAQNSKTIGQMEGLLKKYAQHRTDSDDRKNARQFLEKLLVIIKALHDDFYPAFDNGGQPSIFTLGSFGKKLKKLIECPFYNHLVSSNPTIPQDLMALEIVQLAAETLEQTEPVIQSLFPHIQSNTLLKFYNSITESAFFKAAPQHYKTWVEANSTKIHSDQGQGTALTKILNKALADYKNELLGYLTKAERKYLRQHPKTDVNGEIPDSINKGMEKFNDEKELTRLLLELRQREILHYPQIMTPLIQEADTFSTDNQSLHDVCQKMVKIDMFTTKYRQEIQQYADLSLKELFDKHQIAFQDHPLYAQKNPLQYHGIGADDQDMRVLAAIDDEEQISPLCDQLRTKIDSIPDLSNDLKTQARSHFSTEADAYLQDFHTRLQTTTDEAQLQTLERDIITIKDQNDLLSAISSLGNHSLVEELKASYSQFLENLDQLIERVRTKIRTENNGHIDETIRQNNLKFDEIVQSYREGSLESLITSFETKLTTLENDDKDLAAEILRNPIRNDPYLAYTGNTETSLLDSLESKLKEQKTEGIKLEKTLTKLNETSEQFKDFKDNDTKKAEHKKKVRETQDLNQRVHHRIEYLQNAIATENNVLLQKESKAAIKMIKELKSAILESIGNESEVRILQTNEDVVGSILKLKEIIDLKAHSIEKMTLPFTAEDIKKPCQDQLSQLVELHQLSKSNLDLMAKQHASKIIAQLNDDIKRDMIAFETLKKTPITEITRFREKYLQLQEYITEEHQNIDELEKLAPLLEDSLVTKIQKIKDPLLTKQALKDASEDYFKKLHSEGERQRRMAPFTKSLKNYLNTITTRVGLRRDIDRENNVRLLIEDLENYHNKSEGGIQNLLTQLQTIKNKSPGHHLKPLLHGIEAEIYDQLDLPKMIMIDKKQPGNEINSYLVKKLTLDETIAEMKTYGESLKTKNDPTGQVVIQLSETLTSYVDDFFKRNPTTAPTPAECERFLNKFHARLHSQDGIMEKHSHHKWLPIVKNILAALLLILPIKMLCSKLGKEKRCGFFGEQTRKMTLRDKVEQALHDIPMSTQPAAGV